jgi:AcrR family transcriptional regulator
MAYDSTATKARLLDAAYGEFVSFGLAGARVDRIAKEASANKQAIYLYFGSKEALFEAVLADRLRILADVAPFTPEDLGGYAGALFDALVADPGIQRLSLWKTLEIPDASEGEVDAHVSKAAALAKHFGVSITTATDILMIVFAAALSWNTTAEQIRNPADEDIVQRLAEHRAAIVSATAAVASAFRRNR